MIRITKPIIEASVVKIGEKPPQPENKCGECGGDLIKKDGCWTCKDCGSSACGI